MKNRAAIFLFYDKEGVVDDYVSYFLQALRPFVNRIIFVANGVLTDEARQKAEVVANEVIVRENTGFDVWGYKAGLSKMGYDNLSNIDELLLVNHTFYGPLFPLSEMFDAMEQRADDFWGISIHKQMVPNPFTRNGVLPEHINSHFIAVRQPLLSSKHFRSYWEDMPPIESYVDSILKHESKFTKHFGDLGYKYSSYVDAKKYDSAYPVFVDVAETIENRSPILKRRPFFHESRFLEENAVDLVRALDLLDETSSYNPELIWRNIVREAKPRILATNAALLEIIPATTDKIEPFTSTLKIAVCVHLYYVEMLPEVLEYTTRTPKGADLIITTSSAEKREQILANLADQTHFRQVFVLVMEENRGRDMAALFITCRDMFLNDEYDLVCRIHSKASPQLGRSRSLMFKYHLLENLLCTEGYVRNVVEMFERKPWIGMAFPPIPHISLPTMGTAWFNNMPETIKVLRALGVKVPLDDDTPIAPYGTMFWFRPAALRKLFEHKWQWAEFNKEPHHVDGGLAHGLERSIAYVAMAARFVPMQIMSPLQAAQNYTMLEYKLQKKLASEQTIKQLVRMLGRAMKRSIRHRASRLVSSRHR